MKWADVERANFSSRLLLCLENIGLGNNYTAFAKAFNFRSSSGAVTVHAARKWLIGESFPTQEKIVVLAAWFQVSPEWLRFGVGDHVVPSVAPVSRPHTSLAADIQMLTVEECRIVEALIQAIVMARPKS